MFRKLRALSGGRLKWVDRGMFHQTSSKGLLPQLLVLPVIPASIELHLGEAYESQPDAAEEAALSPRTQRRKHWHK